MSAATFPALPAAAQEPAGSPPPETVSAALSRAPFLTTEAMIGAGRSPLSEDLLAADSGGILDVMRNFLDSILEGDLLPAITLKDATVAGVGGDELGYAYGQEAAALEGGLDRPSEAGPGVELADVPNPATADGPGGTEGDGSGDGSGDGVADSSFASPSLGGNPGSLDDVESADPSGFGTEERDFAPDDGELASLGLPGESPPSDLAPQGNVPGAKETAPPSVPEAQSVPPRPDDATSSPPVASQPAPPADPPAAYPPAADPPLAVVPDRGSYGATPEDDGPSSDDAAGTVPADAPPGAADPYAPPEPAPAPYPSLQEPPDPGTETDAGQAEGGHDPGATGGATGTVVGAIVSDPADSSGEYPGAYPDDPDPDPADGSVPPAAVGPLPEVPQNQTAGEGADAEPPYDEEATGGEATGGATTDGQDPDPPINPESGPDGGLTDVSGSDAFESPDDAASPTNGGADLASPDPTATEDGATDGSQAPQPDDPADQTQSPQEAAQPDQTDGQTDPMDPAVDDVDAQTDAPATGPSDGGPRQGSSGGADAVHTPDAERRQDVPEDPTTPDWDEREVAAGSTGDLSPAGYPDGSGQTTARKKAPDAPEPVVSGRDATQTLHESTRDAHAASSRRAAIREDRRAESLVERLAERRAARVAERKTDRRAARQAQRQAAAVADRRADRRAGRVAETRVQRQAPSLSVRVPSTRRAAGIARGRAAQAPGRAKPGRAAPASETSYGARLSPAASTPPRTANTGRRPVPRPRLATPNPAAPAPTPASRSVAGQVSRPPARTGASPGPSGGPSSPPAAGTPRPAFSAPAWRQAVPDPTGKTIGG